MEHIITNPARQHISKIITIQSLLSKLNARCAVAIVGQQKLKLHQATQNVLKEQLEKTVILGRKMLRAFYFTDYKF
jgi:hypothetical protein